MTKTHFKNTTTRDNIIIINVLSKHRNTHGN